MYLFFVNQQKINLINLPRTMVGKQPFSNLSKTFLTRKANEDNEKYLKIFENLINKWYAQDELVYAQLDNLQRQLNSGLDKVNELCYTGNIKEALLELHSFLKDSEKSFFELKKLFQQLEQITPRLYKNK
jgi:hypothetical protein